MPLKVFPQLQHEADNVVNLKPTLSQPDEELQDERVLRENAEAAQRNLVNELKEGDSSTKDLNSIISRLSHELDSANSRLRKVTGEKSKLDIRVGEMEVLIQRQQMMPPPPQKTPGRPRSSSLTHLNIVSMEWELDTLHSMSKSYQTELESSRARISKMQDDLVRVENEKLVSRNISSIRTCFYVLPLRKWKSVSGKCRILMALAALLRGRSSSSLDWKRKKRRSSF